MTAEPTRPDSQSFLSLLHKNVLNRRRWATREQLRLAIVVWISTHATAGGARTPSAE
jgi:hypothetical protein